MSHVSGAGLRSDLFCPQVITSCAQIVTDPCFPTTHVFVECVCNNYIRHAAHLSQFRKFRYTPQQSSNIVMSFLHRIHKNGLPHFYRTRHDHVHMTEMQAKYTLQLSISKLSTMQCENVRQRTDCFLQLSPHLDHSFVVLVELIERVLIVEVKRPAPAGLLRSGL